jgi:hypothetical protein
VSSNLLRCIHTASPCFKRTYRNYRSFGSLSMRIFSCFSHPLGATCSTKFERSNQNACVLSHGIVAGNLPWRETLPSVRNGLFALEGLTFTTVFPGQSSARLYRVEDETCAYSGDRYGLNSPVEQLPLRSLLLGGSDFCPTAKLYDHCLALYNFSTVLQFVEFCKMPSGPLRFSTTFVRVPS